MLPFFTIGGLSTVLSITLCMTIPNLETISSTRRNSNSDDEESETLVNQDESGQDGQNGHPQEQCNGIRPNLRSAPGYNTVYSHSLEMIIRRTVKFHMSFSTTNHANSQVSNDRQLAGPALPFRRSLQRPLRQRHAGIHARAASQGDGRLHHRHWSLLPRLRMLLQHWQHALWIGMSLNRVALTFHKGPLINDVPNILGFFKHPLHLSLSHSHNLSVPSAIVCFWAISSPPSVHADVTYGWILIPLFS